jgi:glycosyltransferase involved in cell wall biosynthesis
MFTVIIPSYNEEKCLPLLLDDLCQQTYKDFRVIVVDGRSTDKTVKYATRFQKKLNLTILNSQKRHVSYQKNWAANKANTPWIIFVDADVRLPKNYLELVHLQLTDVRNCCATTSYYVLSRNPVHRSLQRLAYHYMQLTKLLGKPRVVETVFICDTQLFRKLKGFNKKITINEGTELVDRIFNNGGEFVLLKQPKYGLNNRRLQYQGVWRWSLNQALVELARISPLPLLPTNPSRIYPMDDRYR